MNAPLWREEICPVCKNRMIYQGATATGKAPLFDHYICYCCDSRISVQQTKAEENQ